MSVVEPAFLLMFDKESNGVERVVKIEIHCGPSVISVDYQAGCRAIPTTDRSLRIRNPDTERQPAWLLTCVKSNKLRIREISSERRGSRYRIKENCFLVCGHFVIRVAISVAPIAVGVL